MSATHYDVLGIGLEATPDELHRAYVAAARAFHPDHAGGDADRMREVNAAWEVLSDPVRRAEYDQRLGVTRTRTSASDAVAHDRDPVAVDLDATPFTMPVIVAPTGWLAVAPVAVFALSVALLSVGLVVSSTGLLVLAVAAFVLASGMFVLSPLVAMSRGRVRRRR
jgi:hypothetical protein